MAETMSFRRAELRDKAGVIDILTAYQGGDYLPDMYETFIKDPSFVGVIAELEGKVVAFAGAYLINKGTTMQTKASRVRPDLQGRGIYRKLLSYLQEKVTELSPDVKFEELTVNMHNRLLSVPEAEREYKELYRTPITSYATTGDFCTPSDGGDTSVFSPSHDITEFSTDVLREIFNNTKVCVALFLIRLVLGWLVYHPVAENVDIMTRTERYITGCTGTDGKMESMMFGVWYQCEGFLSYDIDCYGEVNATKLLAHLKKHAIKGLSLSSDEVHFSIAADGRTTQMLDKTCQSLGLKPTDCDTTYYAVMVRAL